MGIYKKLLEKYSEALTNAYKPNNLTLGGNGTGKDEGLRAFERIRNILEFYATATGNAEATSNFTMNAFGENNRVVIGKVLRYARSLEDDSHLGDFVIFLENVVRADCEIEGEDEDE